MKWKPIDTAPLDHCRDVLLFGDGDSFDLCMFVGFWDNDAKKWCPFDGNESVQPTHWMPLPRPPAV